MMALLQQLGKSLRIRNEKYLKTSVCFVYAIQYEGQLKQLDTWVVTCKVSMRGCVAPCLFMSRVQVTGAATSIMFEALITGSALRCK